MLTSRLSGGEGGGEDAGVVAAQNFAGVGLGKAGLQEGFGESGQGVVVGEDGAADEAAQVRADADMVDAGRGGHADDAGGHGGKVGVDRRGWPDADDAAGVGDQFRVLRRDLAAEGAGPAGEGGVG